VDIHNAVDALVIILQGDVILDRPQVIAQVLPASGTGSGKNATFFIHADLLWFIHLQEICEQVVDLFRIGHAPGL
jgi:hypothetical protein